MASSTTCRDWQHRAWISAISFALGACSTTSGGSPLDEFAQGASDGATPSGDETGGSALPRDGSPGNGGSSGSPAGGSGDAAVSADAGPFSASNGDGGTRWASRPIASPPTYMGYMGGSSCDTSLSTVGFEPDDATGGRHPLFLYFVGTSLVSTDQSAVYDSLAAKTVTEAMARRGFFAISVQYDNDLSLSANKMTCVYDSTNPKSLVSVACKLPQVDCNVAIATWGHSQGALMAHIASQFDSRVHAVWTTGYSGGSYPLPVNRLRVVNGAADTMNGAWSTITKAAGFAAAECPNDGGTECLRADGSGFIIVEKQDCITSSADHCWFDRRSCGDSVITLEPNWTDRTSTKDFALESNADWVAATALRP